VLRRAGRAPEGEGSGIGSRASIERRTRDVIDRSAGDSVDHGTCSTAGVDRTVGDGRSRSYVASRCGTFCDIRRRASDDTRGARVSC